MKFQEFSQEFHEFWKYFFCGFCEGSLLFERLKSIKQPFVDVRREAESVGSSTSMALMVCGNALFTSQAYTRCDQFRQGSRQS